MGPLIIGMRNVTNEVGTVLGDRPDEGIVINYKRCLEPSPLQLGLPEKIGVPEHMATMRP